MIKSPLAFILLLLAVVAVTVVATFIAVMEGMTTADDTCFVAGIFLGSATAAAFAAWGVLRLLQ